MVKGEHLEQLKDNTKIEKKIQLLMSKQLLDFKVAKIIIFRQNVKKARKFKMLTYAGTERCTS